MGKNTYLELTEEYLNLFQTQKGKIIVQERIKIDESIKAIQLKDYLIKVSFSIPKKINLLVPSHWLFFRTLELPPSAGNKLEEIIKLKFLTSLPYSSEELYFTYHIISDQEDRLRVLVFAASKEKIDNYYQLSQNAGLKIKSIIPAALIFFILHQGERPLSEPVLYLDLQPGYQNYTFFFKGDVYIRASAGRNYLREEVNKTLSYLQKDYKLRDRPELIVDGRKEDYNLLQEEFKTAASSLGKTDIIVSAEKSLKNKGFLKQVSGKKGSRKNVSYRWIIALIVLILIINGLGLGLKWKIKEQEFNKIEEKITELRPAVERVNQLKEEYQFSREELEQLKDEIKPTYNYLPWLRELSRILPDDLIIDRITFKEEGLELFSGKASSAAQVMSRLEESPNFTNLYFIGSIIIEEDGERFRIAGDLRDGFE